MAKNLFVVSWFEDNNFQSFSRYIPTECKLMLDNFSTTSIASSEFRVLNFKVNRGHGKFI